MLPQTFHPIINSWFAETYGKPTPVQAEAWPLIECGENVLALAPTGSGKTLTAFLSAISRFCGSPESDKQYAADKLSVLYVSPLKALNEDIKRNLLQPLAAIKARFEKEGMIFPHVRVETRSGDTPQSERRRFMIQPPSILALTPESLAILLLNPKGRQILSGVKYLIIDEIHAVLGNKRGAFLSCQIDRLTLIAGEFQRISLSATVRNPQIAAEFVGGKTGKVRIVAPPSEKKIDFSVAYPFTEEAEAERETDENLIRIEKYGKSYLWIIDYIVKRINEGGVLLIFVESRRRAERLCYFLNLEGVAAFTHHGSLAKELRRSVEKGLAEGSLSCVVATASLELGIDIGSVDEVVLAGSPGNVSQALQRTGRSGHGVGQVSKGILFAFHGMDLLLAAALKGAVDERDIEEVRPIENPLDILAQIILASCTEKDWFIDDLYDLIRGFYIYRNLGRDSFDRTVYMLAGLDCNGGKRLRDIKPRIWLDKLTETTGALAGTLFLLYSSGGVIANRGMYSLRLADGTKIGELDEEFVWERRIGDCFDFGARGWRITTIGPESVVVNPLEKSADDIPFWKGETVFRSANLTERIFAILELYNNNGNIEAGLEPEINDSLNAFLDSQSRAQNNESRGSPKIPLPDRKNVIIEIIEKNELNRDFCSIIFHSFRGGAVNYPLSLALSQELEEMIELRVESFSNDNSILFLLPRLGLESAAAAPAEIFQSALAALETPDSGDISRGERNFRNRLETSGIFGANFREAAERSMLLPKSPFGKRTPLWIMRQRSKRLFDAVAGEDGCPVTAEAWRTCLVDIFDMEGFRNLITDINNGSVVLSFFTGSMPSPFSKDIVREETNSFMYDNDERKDLAGKSRTAALSDKVIEEAIGNAALRPVLKQEVIESFVSRLRREIPLYAPDDLLSLNEWVKERIAIPLDEWKTLCNVLPLSLIDGIDSARIKTVKRNGASIESVVHREWEESWNNEALSLLGLWLRYEGPVSIQRICEVFGAGAGEAEDAVKTLVEADEVLEVLTGENAEISGSAPTDNKPRFLLFCDRENYEMLLRISRKRGRPEIKERPASMLVPFLALRQGMGTGDVIFSKNLYAWTAPAKLWETEILCARNPGYTTEGLDKEIREGRLIWYGAETAKGGKERIGFCRPEDLDLVQPVTQKNTDNDSHGLTSSVPDPLFFNRPRDFWEIKNELGMDIRACAEVLWKEVWQGCLTADSFEPVRRGIDLGFVPKKTELPQITETVHPFGRRPRIPAALRNRRRGGAPVHGNWFSLVPPEEQSELNPLEEDVLNRDRVRLLLDRWGLLCRPLLERESPVFSWSKLLPTMRRMELAGELIAGRFFSGVNSLQFASPSIIAELEHAENFDGIYWMNAADPASPAGLEIEWKDLSLCARSSGNRLFFKGAKVIALTVKNGKEVQIFIEAGDPSLAQLIELLKIPRTRPVMPEKRIVIEKINGEAAGKSIFAGEFKIQKFESDRGRLCFW